MKLEKRGKFAGVKIHLSAIECMDLVKSAKTRFPLLKRMTHLIHQAIENDPTILENRTSAEIEATLAKERSKAEQRLRNLDTYLEKIGWEKIT